jgi:hypothetical protein
MGMHSSWSSGVRWDDGEYRAAAHVSIQTFPLNEIVGKNTKYYTRNCISHCRAQYIQVKGSLFRVIIA